MRLLRSVALIGWLLLHTSLAAAGAPPTQERPGLLEFELTVLPGPGGRSSSASAFWIDGSRGPCWVVGSVATETNDTHAGLWSDGGWTDLGTLGGTSSTATAVFPGELGPVVLGQSRNAQGELRAFFWENGAMRDLESLDPAARRAYAARALAASTAQHEVTANIGRAANPQAWTAQNLIGRLHGNPHRAVLLDAPAIDPRGYVAGTCSVRGQRQAYLLTPVLLAAPVITGVLPSSATQGQTLSVTIHGHGFVPGATADLGPGITVNSAVVHSTGPASADITPLLDHILQLNITVAADALPGTRSVTVVNPNSQSATRPNAFTVIATPTAPKLDTFTLSATTVKGGTLLTGNVTLTDPAGRRNAKVTFKSNKRGFAAPGAKVIRRGATTLPRPFNYRTKRVRTTTVYSITASYGGVSRTVEITLTP